jgi:hypothetical protein
MIGLPVLSAMWLRLEDGILGNAHANQDGRVTLQMAEAGNWMLQLLALHMGYIKERRMTLPDVARKSLLRFVPR